MGKDTTGHLPPIFPSTKQVPHIRNSIHINAVFTYFVAFEFSVNANNFLVIHQIIKFGVVFVLI